MRAVTLFKLLFVLLLTVWRGLFTLVSGQVLQSQLADEATETTVLFVGNSLTYANDLPLLFENYAASKNRKVKTQMLALPNYALVDHLADGRLQTLLRKGFDFVVVQQGPSSQTEGKELLLEAGRELKKLCLAENSTLAFFMVWPAYANYHTFDKVIQNYSEAAADTKSILIPVGKEMKKWVDEKQDLSWYGPDMFHPSERGSEMAAKIIYESLFGNK